MYKYAKIIDNIVINIFESFVELSDTTAVYLHEDIPIIGDIYDPINKIFYKKTSVWYAKEKNQQTKQLASKKILSMLSETDQRNSLYRLYKHGKKSKSSLTKEEKDEIQDIESKWDSIEIIRDASNKIEAEINSLQTVEEIQNYDIVNNYLWPV